KGVFNSDETAAGDLSSLKAAFRGGGLATGACHALRLTWQTLWTGSISEDDAKTLKNGETIVRSGIQDPK
ncbi:MAG: hypothetical protein ACE5JX_21175, partial [Acidobacteriota bacterium]